MRRRRRASPVPQPRSMACLKQCRLLRGRRARRLHRLEQQRRARDSRDRRPAACLEARRILVEQRPAHRPVGIAGHVLRRRAASDAGPAPCRSSGSQRRASPEGRDGRCRARRAAARISPSVNQAEVKSRRELDRLLEQIGGGGQIALQLRGRARTRSGGRPPGRRRTGTGAGRDSGTMKGHRRRMTRMKTRAQPI